MVRQHPRPLAATQVAVVCLTRPHARDQSRGLRARILATVPRCQGDFPVVVGSARSPVDSLTEDS